VPRRDCIPRRGRSNDGTGRDHHAARRIADEQEDVAGERATEAAPRGHGRADDDELGPMLGGDACDLLAEASGPRSHELSPDADAIRRCDRGRGLEPLLQLGEPAVHVRVERQLALDDERCDEQHTRAAIGREAAREIESMLGLLPVEQRHDDAAIRDRARPASEAPRPPTEDPEIQNLHRMSWYGTDARITLGSTSSSRFT
jgi:hypothetical protein